MSRCTSWDESILQAIEHANSSTVENFEVICKLAVLVFHAEKRSKRRITRTADACGWTAQVMEETVLALAKILMDAAKGELSEYQLESVLKGLQLEPAHAAVFIKLYLDHANSIRENVCRDTGTNLPQYKKLDWRVDLEIGTRFLRNRPKPIVTLRLDTISQASSSDLPTHASTCMRVDYENLCKLQRQLEIALKEVDSVHCGRIQRYMH